MPETLQLGPIGQISRNVRDIKKAEAWYKDVLRLSHLFTFGYLAFFDCDGTRLFLSTPEEVQPMHEESVIYFQVEDIQGAHKTLRSRGVTFQSAPHMIHKHPDGTKDKMDGVLRGQRRRPPGDDGAGRAEGVRIVRPGVGLRAGPPRAQHAAPLRWERRRRGPGERMAWVHP